jgi:multiple antibiotic resistance protein
LDVHHLVAALAILGKSIPVALASLIPVMNPIGTSLILLSMTEGISDFDRKRLARRIAANAFALLTAVLLAGAMVLSFFGITISIVQVAGGLVLASMGWALLKSDPAAPTNSPAPTNALPQGGSTSSWTSRAFYPFTFPLTVGPGCVAVALTLGAHTSHDTWEMTLVDRAGAVLGISIASLVMYFSFAYSRRLVTRLGPSGTSVLMRLLAFIVICIGAQICWAGVRTLIHSV